MPVDRQLVSAIRMQIEKNREKLLSILKTVFFCGRHNVHLRGHRDDSKHMLEDSRSTGNFQALLHFRTDAGDHISKEHFATAPQNATYRSKTIKNELVDCVANLIGQK